MDQRRGLYFTLFHQGEASLGALAWRVARGDLCHTLLDTDERRELLQLPSPIVRASVRRRGLQERPLPSRTAREREGVHARMPCYKVVKGTRARVCLCVRDFLAFSATATLPSRYPTPQPLPSPCPSRYPPHPPTTHPDVSLLI